MGKAAPAEFCGKLQRSSVYNGCVKSASESCKENAVAYLEQDGLLSDTPYTIVNSDWTGSMQRMMWVLTGGGKRGFTSICIQRGMLRTGSFRPTCLKLFVVRPTE